MVKALLTKMLNANPEKRPTIYEICTTWMEAVDVDIFLLFWHCLCAFTKPSFLLPDHRICLLKEVI